MNRRREKESVKNMQRREQGANMERGGGHTNGYIGQSEYTSFERGKKSQNEADRGRERHREGELEKGAIE